MQSKLTSSEIDEFRNNANKKISKLKMLSEHCDISYDRFILYKNPNNTLRSLYDAFTDRLYPNSIIDKLTNNCGILCFTTWSNDKLHTLVFIDDKAEWKYSERERTKARFLNVMQPLVLNGQCILCSKEMFNSRYPVDQQRSVVMFTGEEGDIKRLYFVDIVDRTLIGSIEYELLVSLTLLPNDTILVNIGRFADGVNGYKLNTFTVLVNKDEVKVVEGSSRGTKDV